MTKLKHDQYQSLSVTLHNHSQQHMEQHTTL